MSPEHEVNVPLALRLIACGLPMPKTITSHVKAGYIFSLETGPVPVGGTCTFKRLLYVVAIVDNVPTLLPDTTDFALLGWLMVHLRKIYGATFATGAYPGVALWGAYGVQDRAYGLISDAPTELEALTAALEAALVAGKVAK